jgi:hypothetical protein
VTHRGSKKSTGFFFEITNSFIQAITLWRSSV